MGDPPIRPYPGPALPAALRPWNPRAPDVAARVAALIAERLPDAAVEQVGSSSVPGCAGKGYLDLLIPFRDAEHLAAIDAALFELGFGRQRNRDPFPETRPLRIGVIEDEPQAFLIHAHVVPETSPEVKALREFRDRLRANPALLESYVSAKHAILDSGVSDNREYRDRKGEFIAALGYKGAEDAR